MALTKEDDVSAREEVKTEIFAPNFASQYKTDGWYSYVL